MAAFIAKALLGGAISAAGGKGLNEIFGWKRGGIIPGKKGKSKLAVLHAGEMVLTPAQQKKLKNAKSAQTVRKTLQTVAKTKPKKIKLRGKKKS